MRRGRFVLGFGISVALGSSLLGTPARSQTPPDELPADDGQERVPRLVTALQRSDSFKVRATAAVALGRIGDARAQPALSEALVTDGHYAVRAAAATALSRLGAGEAVAPLLAALSDPDGFVRDAAHVGLERFHGKDHLIHFQLALTDDDPEVRLEAVRANAEALRAGETRAALAVVAALGDDDEQVTAAAEKGLASLPHDRALPLLLRGLEGGGPSVRAACARLLGKRADPTAVRPLIVASTSTSEPEDVRKAARAALQNHIEYIDVASVTAQAKDSASAPRVRIEALRTLGAVGSPVALEVAGTALTDPDASVRVAAARTAVDVGGGKARQLLLDAVERESDARQKRQLELLLKSLR